MSSWRNTFLPSAFTSIENMTGLAVPLILFETTPRSEPASSPVLVRNTESLTMMGLPCALTVLAVSDASVDWEILGYGMGTGLGAIGVLQTSGKDERMPVLD